MKLVLKIAICCILTCLFCTVATAQARFAGKIRTEAGEYFRENRDTGFYHYDHYWISDSMYISDINTAVEKTKKGVTTRSVMVRLYVFVDYRSKTLFEYSSMSDTARLLGSHYLYDTFSLSTGFPFDITREDARKSVKDTVRLPDTIIENKTYKRYMQKLDTMNRTEYLVFYLSCQSNPGVTFYPTLAEKLGCPITIITGSLSPYLQAKPYMFTTRTLERDYLTQEEQKVFAAWRKYAEEHPVKPSSPKRKSKSRKRKKHSDE
ncbi:hypothetical protein LZZ85_22715 [Terrimonas sp. NA20]|uniref:Lipoprotein n=1 Tax=Terrimonas ginsenosidimutans TaxID=2908004 RepID=A0ABS9KXT3_9BACT|nr:hypothetical protein [Terrimonas ginsenosidimutans]MCG2617126.1 hypothetical protein [Terrimonas ginsenosidimutans]